MRIKIMAIVKGVMILLPLATGCATTMLVTSSTISKDMEAIKRDINSNESAMYNLKNRRVGRTGFYYIVDSEGKVVFHPQTALIGTRFKDHWFINKIIAERSGCLTYQLGNRTHVVYFEPLNDSDILCLSIVSDDIRQPAADCKQAEVK